MDTAKDIIDTYRIKDLKRYAADNGLRIVYPEHNQLLIDIDSDEDFQTFKDQFKILSEKFKVLWTVTPSRSKPQGKHIIVTVPGANFSDLERIAFQAVLGSDRKRELLSIFDIIKGDSHPTVFFEKEEEPNEARPKTEVIR